MYARMTQFEPQTMGQQSIHESTLRQFDTCLQSRRERLYSVVSGMPRIRWYTVALGALINMIFLWLFDLKLGNHLLLGGLVSFFMATMVRLIATFRGEVGVSPEALPIGLSTDAAGLEQPRGFSAQACPRPWQLPRAPSKRRVG